MSFYFLLYFGQIEENDLGLEKPTPAMLKQKRKSLSMARAAELAKGATDEKDVNSGLNSSRVSTIGQKRPALEPSPNLAASSQQQQKAKKAKVKTVATSKKLAQQHLLQGYIGPNGSSVHLMVTDPLSLSLASLKAEVPKFQGANLAVLHTPALWEPPQVFNMVRLVRDINKGAGLTTFLVLVGCGLSNVHMFREALIRQTSHVQFVVFENKTANEDDGFKLRDTTSFFLLGYFFPGCEAPGSLPCERMVRVHGTILLC